MERIYRKIMKTNISGDAEYKTIKSKEIENPPEIVVCNSS